MRDRGNNLCTSMSDIVWVCVCVCVGGGVRGRRRGRGAAERDSERNKFFYTRKSEFARLGVTV